MGISIIKSGFTVETPFQSNNQSCPQQWNKQVLWHLIASNETTATLPWFLPKMHPLNLIMRKHQTDPYWETYYKRTGLYNLQKCLHNPFSSQFWFLLVGGEALEVEEWVGSKTKDMEGQGPCTGLGLGGGLKHTHQTPQMLQMIAVKLRKGKEPGWKSHSACLNGPLSHSYVHRAKAHSLQEPWKTLV